MFAQLVPEELQRCHWYPKLIGAVPLQVPGDAVSTCPSVGVPETVGGLVFEGGTAGAEMTAVAEDGADAFPATFVAVTTTRIVDPTSADVRTYVCDDAPAMLVQVDPD